MGAFNELPVYKAAYDLLLEIFKFSASLKREYKFTLGEKLKNEVTDLLTTIYKANKTHNKLELIDNARENTEIVRLYLRVLKDLNEIGLKRHVALNEQVENISKQLAGWYNHSK